MSSYQGYTNRPFHPASISSYSLQSTDCYVSISSQEMFECRLRQAHSSSSLRNYSGSSPAIDQDNVTFIYPNRPFLTRQDSFGAASSSSTQTTPKNLIPYLDRRNDMFFLEEEIEEAENFVKTCVNKSMDQVKKTWKAQFTPDKKKQRLYRKAKLEKMAYDARHFVTDGSKNVFRRMCGKKNISPSDEWSRMLARNYERADWAAQE
ncbi:hypothetical protein RUND412_005298 [Rhizina undulata]